MCGSAPKPPKKTAADLAAEKEAELMRKNALEEQRAIRADNKKVRFDMMRGALSGGFGRSSLLTGGRGGQGYGAPAVRSLLDG